MSGFTSPDGDLDRVFFTTSELMDRFVGTGLWNWGLGTNGQLGDNTVSTRSSPVSPISGLNFWKDIAGGTLFTIGIKTDGTLWTWGANNFGQLGTNNTSGRSSPVQTVSSGTTWLQASAAAGTAAAVKTDGTLWTWGQNTTGQVGDGTTSNRSSPVTTSGGGSNWEQVSGGGAMFGAIKADGSLWLWGNNNNGQLGDGTILNKSSPVTTSGGGTTWKQVACGYLFSTAIKTDGTLWTWGQNTSGQLGDNTTSNRSSPVTTVTGGNTWKQVTAGLSCTLAIKTDGTLWVWGSNANGQLGTNNTSNYSSPVTITGGGTTWKQVGSIAPTTASGSSAAVKTDGTLWTWGLNSNGRLGTNNTSNFSSPVNPVGGITNWIKAVALDNRTIALAQL